MKDFIVLISTILLGVAIAALVLGFKTSANTINDKATDSITKAFSSICIEEIA